MNEFALTWKIGGRGLASLALLLIFIVNTLPLKAQAKISKKRSYFTVSTTYSAYNDIKISSSGEKLKLPQTVDIDMGIKLDDNFSLLIAMSQSSDSTLSGYGAGFLIDLPGFFFLGGGSRRQRAKNFPINTSLYFTSLLTERIESDNAITKTVATRYGLNLDLFVFNNITYLKFDASLYNLSGNSYASYGIGLGAEF